MNQQQQRILMRSSLAMGVTMAVGMLAFGQMARSSRPGPADPVMAEGARTSQVTTVGDPQGGLVITDAASTAIVAEDISVQPQTLSRVSREHDDDEHEEHHESSKRPERREHR